MTYCSFWSFSSYSAHTPDTECFGPSWDYAAKSSIFSDGAQATCPTDSFRGIWEAKKFSHVRQVQNEIIRVNLARSGSYLYSLLQEYRLCPQDSHLLDVGVGMS